MKVVMENELRERIVEALIEILNDEGDAHSRTLKDEHLRNGQALSRVIRLVKEFPNKRLTNTPPTVTT